MIGIALAGGGAKGAYEVGAYIALKGNGIKPKIIAGTSIGSVNAAMMVQGDIDKLVSLWLTTGSDIFGIDKNLATAIKNKKFTFGDIKLGFASIQSFFKNKGIGTDPFLKMLSENIDERKIRNSKIKLGLNTVKLKDRKLIPMDITIDNIPEGKVPEYILASCYWPFFNYKKIIDDEYYLDGGFYNNIPIELVEKEGCNLIFAIKIGGFGIDHNTIKPETKVIEIKPNKSLGSMLFMNPEVNNRNMKMGYYDGLKMLNKIDGIYYYFKRRNNFYYKLLTYKVSEDTMFKLRLKYKKTNTKEVVIKATEDLMKKNNFEEIKIYNLKSIIKVLKKNNEYKNKLLSTFINSCK